MPALRKRPAARAGRPGPTIPIARGCDHDPRGFDLCQPDPRKPGRLLAVCACGMWLLRDGQRYRAWVPFAFFPEPPPLNVPPAPTPR
jgi:hypothetical protein